MLFSFNVNWCKTEMKRDRDQQLGRLGTWVPTGYALSCALHICQTCVFLLCLNSFNVLFFALHISLFSINGTKSII